VVLAELLKERGLLPEFTGEIEVFALIEDESLRDSTISLVQSLREKSLSVDYSIVPLKPDKQFKRALEHGVRFTVRMEDQTTAKVKNLKTRDEQTLATSEVATHLMAAALKSA
jgi:histidyl-tRNA synthetase